MGYYNPSSVYPHPGRGPPYPNVGTNINDDYNPSTRTFRVPVVLRDDLIRKGGNYIEEYVPPRIVLDDSRVFVLTTHAALDIYRVDRRGTGIFKTNGYDVVQFPVHKVPSNSDVIRYFLVSEMIVSRRGLSELANSLPKISLQIDPDKPPVQYFVFSGEKARTHKLQTSGRFEIPITNRHGPYPLKLDKTGPSPSGATERFAIPPPPSGGLTTNKPEYQQAETTINDVIMFAVIEFAVCIFLFLLYKYDD